ncbi:hypothetical protein D3C74_380650 [compost metagenome]
MASNIWSRFVSADSSSWNAKAAAIPCGMVLLGITVIRRSSSSSSRACSAASTIFELFGSMNTCSAAMERTAFTKSSVLGFIVCPPDRTTSTPRLWKISAIPSPEDTAIKPYGAISSAGSTASSILRAASRGISANNSGDGAISMPAVRRSRCCSRILRI